MRSNYFPGRAHRKEFLAVFHENELYTFDLVEEARGQHQSMEVMLTQAEVNKLIKYLRKMKLRKAKWKREGLLK